MADERELPAFSIRSLEGPRVVVTGSYNPKEISVDRAVPWAKSARSSADPPDLEFTSAAGRSMSFELMFDTFETQQNVHAEFVGNLMQLTLVDAALKRPPRVAVTWGRDGVLDFQGVIESIGVKYTMFLADGTPVRAICHVRIREAGRLACRADT
jgi:hypothetical protein